MSRKKEKKIKRLKRVSVLPVIFKQILTETAILAFSIIIGFLVILAVMQDSFTGMAKDCETILSTVNGSWSENDNAPLLERLKNQEKDLPTVEKIFLIDSETHKPVAGLNEDDFDPETINDSHSFFKNDKKSIYSPEENILLGINFGFGKGLDLKQFFKAISINALTDEESSNWASKEQSRINFYSLYRTDVPGLSVLICTPFIITTMHQHILGFLGVLVTFEFIICIIIEFVTLFSLLAEKRKINNLFYIDPMTGGLNRSYFLQRGAKLIKRQGKNYAVVHIRLEKYRNLCTAYGIKKGENILETLDHAMRKMLGKKEIVSHLEDADFAMLLSYGDNDGLTERIYGMLEKLSRVEGDAHLNFSAGICHVPGKRSDMSNLLNDAALALPRETKAQNEIAWFDQKMKENTVWERHLEDDMERAIAEHEFSVYLQPKYSAHNETLDAAEALVRWIHPELGFISPGSFIPLFERNGFILKLDDYMLSEVCKLQAKWISEGKKVVPISVNVSRAHFATADLAEHIKSIVDQWSVPYEYIELELTESAFFDDKATLLETVKHLKDFGFKLSMDDFGAGYSSLNSLKELPLDIIKLDAEFFRGVEDLSRSNLIVGDTIALAKKLGMRIVAEGIETREQVDFLAQKDCDLIQGFYFSKPLPVNEFEEKAFPEKKSDESE